MLPLLIVIASSPNTQIHIEASERERERIQRKGNSGIIQNILTGHIQICIAKSIHEKYSYVHIKTRVHVLKYTE